jgi:hypothetical protein
MAFLQAIEVGEPPSAAEGLDLDSIGMLRVAFGNVARVLMRGAVVEAEYDGVRLEKEMTQEFIDDMIKRFKVGKKLHKKYAYQIVIMAKEVFYNEPTMPEVTVAEGKRMTVCGDTHGNFLLLLRQCRDDQLTALQASSLICWRSLTATVTLQISMPICSTATLSTVAHGRLRLLCCCTPTSCSTPPTSSSIAAITRRTT